MIETVRIKRDNVMQERCRSDDRESTVNFIAIGVIIYETRVNKYMRDGVKQS